MGKGEEESGKPRRWIVMFFEIKDRETGDRSAIRVINARFFWKLPFATCARARYRRRFSSLCRHMWKNRYFIRAMGIFVRDIYRVSIVIWLLGLTKASRRTCTIEEI